jgi:hypothetical protein
VSRKSFGFHLPGVSFCRRPVGLLYLLGESAPASEVTGWTMVIVHVASTFFGDAPRQVCPQRRVAVSLQSPASLSSLQVSGFISGGSPAQSHKEGVNCPLAAYGVDAFSGCLSPLATFSVQSLSFNQEAFRVFRPEDGRCRSLRPFSLTGGGLALAALG